MAVGLLYALAVGVAVVAAFLALRSATAELAHITIAVLGSLITLGFALLPLAFGADDTMEPRRFALFGIPVNKLAVALGLSGLVSIPAVLLVVAAIAQIGTWARGPLPLLFAVGSAVLIVPTCVLAARLSSAIAALTLDSHRSRDAAGVAVVGLLALVVPVLVVAASVDWDRFIRPVVRTVAGVMQWTPFGAVWSMPGQAAIGHLDRALIQLGIAVATVLVLLVAWRLVLGVLLYRPQRERVPRVYVGLGLIGRLPATAGWAVAARSFSYWMRDPRYGAGLAVVPLVPILVCAILLVAGVPGQLIYWLPVPIICLFLGWTAHNDLAHDNTAFWLHVASDVDGRADRAGRLAPLLALGLPVALGGSVATAAIVRDWSILPGLIGLSLGVLLAGLGISSYVSARFPYAVVRPGDSPFAQPQRVGGDGSLIQAFSFLATIVVVLPVVGLIWLGVRVSPGYLWLALSAGLVIGVGLLGLGIVLGGRVVDRAGPELLAAAMRN